MDNRIEEIKASLFMARYLATQAQGSGIPADIYNEDVSYLLEEIEAMRGMIEKGDGQYSWAWMEN